MSKASEQRTYAYIAPFVAFMLVISILPLLDALGIAHDHPYEPWWRQKPEYWVYPLQCLVCLFLLFKYRKHYEMRWSDLRSGKNWVYGVVFGVIGIGFWILPTYLYTSLELSSGTEDDPSWYSYLGLAPRDEGFDAAIFSDVPFAWWLSIIFRFIRAVIVVSLVEEIFWRGFLMRFLNKMEGNYWKEPFGKHSWKSFLIVTICFMLVHAPVDWIGALIFGTFMYYVAHKSKSLTACVIMHGVANLVMGVYAMGFEKYGLW